jgi:hypothetical protein
MTEQSKHLLDVALSLREISERFVENPCCEVGLYRSRKFRSNVQLYMEKL